MDLKRMRYFCTIAEQGQVSRAARVLHMAQPPLSQRLRELEEELGTPLFERKGRSLALTEAGAVFYRRARDILRAVEATREEVMRAASRAGPELRIGVSPTCRRLWLTRFPALQRAFPSHRLGVVVADSSYLEQLLRAGQLDVAFMLPPQQTDNMLVHALLASRTVAVAPRRLLAPALQTLSLAELARHPLLLLRRSVGIGSYEWLLRRFQAEGLSAEVALYGSDVALLLDLLEQGFAGIAVVPESETGGLSDACRVLGIELELPDYRVSLVCRDRAEDAARAAQLLAAWACPPDGDEGIIGGEPPSDPAP